jgi:alcohol dehydrogenase, propanol-preferring
MKALRLVQFQKAPEFQEIPEPDPGPGEVVIKVAGAGACHSDLHFIHDFPEGILPWTFPFTLGHENAGWVHGLGPGVQGLEVGQPVAVYGAWGCGTCHRCRQGLENYCERQAQIGAFGGGLGRDGGMAPYMLVPSARHLVPLATLDPVDAAALTDAGLTPYHAVKRSVPKLVGGSSAVVIGVGGLGHLGVQILRALTPAAIIAVDSRDSALEIAREAGADHLVHAGDGASAEIRELTKGLGAEVVLDFVGVDGTIALGESVVRPLGDVTVVGIGGGSYPFSFFATPNEASLQSTYWGSAPELIELIALAERGLVRPHLQRFDLDDASSVYERLHHGEIVGRAVVVPNG